ncbi:hypothetical protein Glove_38g82 [Diversispora epigaea]|uniref:F-box/LRR-repeat protein 15-like leucin rich repeat domain-containing protein n=1 Tax=Diversispora epigaea TaxID=1348612 RepID=A0A397JFW6_9GLOM|nr:hypothetical protein Glove_38g82 [Diversispora epigaea]
MCEDRVQSAIPPEIKHHTQYLFQLHLSGYRVSSDELYKITRSCPNLRHLKIKWCCSLSDRDISEIAQICSLESIIVSCNSRGIKRSSRLTNMGDTTLFACLCTNFRYLKLGYNKHITDASIIEIAQNCIHLEYFGLRESNITDASLKQIAESCSKLLILSLVGCQKITDEGICAITLTCSNMQKYVLENCEEITDTSVKKIAQSNPKFKYLNLNGCELVSDKSVCKIIQLCPNLEGLQIECCNISDVSMIALANLRNLQKLNIEDCEKISTNAIITSQNKNPTLDIFVLLSLIGMKEEKMPIFVYNIDETSSKSSE